MVSGSDGRRRRSKVANLDERELRLRTKKTNRYSPLAQFPLSNLVGTHPELGQRLVLHKPVDVCFVGHIEDRQSVPDRDAGHDERTGRPQLTFLFKAFQLAG